MIGSVSKFWDGARVNVYTVHEPPNAPADRLELAESLVFLKDGFSWGAALLAPLWLVARAEWMALAAYAAAVMVLAGFLRAIGASPEWVGLAIVALNVFAGFEASSLRRLSLDRRGWQEIGTVSGSSQAECERRFFETWLPGHQVIDSRRPGIAAGSMAETTATPARAYLAGWRGLLGTRR